MKHSFAFFLSTIFALSLYGQGGEITLSGKIKNSPDPEIYVNVPVNGGFYQGAARAFALDTLSGDYSTNLQINEPGFITVSNNWHVVKLYVEPGKNYVWNTEVQGKENVDKFEGHQSEVNTILNTTSSTPDTKTADISTELSKTSTLREKYALVNKTLSEKTAPIQKLLKEGKVNNAFYKAFLNELNVWSKTLLSTHYYFAFRDTEDGKDVAKAAKFKKEILPDWDKIYRHINDSTQWLSATASPALMGRYAGYKEVKETGKISFDGNSFDKEWNYYKTGLRGKPRAFALAELIYREYSNKEYSKKILSGFEQFKQMYPGDPLTASLNTQAEEVAAYYNNLGKSSSVKFVQLPQGTNTADKLFSFLKSDKISYIDMWATWCMPCRAELNYAIPLHGEFEKIGVNTVYLSFDRDSDNDKWETMAKGLALKGTNIRASEELSENLYKTLKNFNGIPRYVILDPDGNVLEENAKRPSDNLELLKQLKYYAEKYNKH